MSLDGIKARRVTTADFERFDYIIAMDEDNLYRLRREAPDNHKAELRLFLEFSAGVETEVPDPYYGDGSGFELVLDLIESGAAGLIDHVKSNRAPSPQ